MSDNPQYPGRQGKKIWFGMTIIILGVIFLLTKLDIFYFDFHQFWPYILIAVGLFSGIKNNFRKSAWWILITIGLVFAIPQFDFKIGNKDIESKEIVIPAILIVWGVMMVFRPKRDEFCRNKKNLPNHSPENSIDMDVVFGGRKEIVTSKEFTGGRATATFGGCEINLINADSVNKIIPIEVRATFGGIEVIVPSHWDVKNEIETVFGSVEDQRSIRTSGSAENTKTLVLQGSCVFGGVEIKSF